MSGIERLVAEIAQLKTRIATLTREREGYAKNQASLIDKVLAAERRAAQGVELLREFIDRVLVDDKSEREGYRCMICGRPDCFKDCPVYKTNILLAAAPTGDATDPKPDGIRKINEGALPP